MKQVFVATLGQRPEVITVGLSRLMEHETFEQVIIVHTNVELSGIYDAYHALGDAFARLYPDLPVISHEIVGVGGAPLIDITDPATATAYYHGVRHLLRDLRRQGWVVHLVVAGGRKSMTLYATLAAAQVFGTYDRVWTIHSDPSLLVEGQFHIPSGMRDRVQVIGLPIAHAKTVILPDDQTDPDEAFIQQRNTSLDFLSRLPESERELAELLKLNSTDSNADLARKLHKSVKTIENQLTSIYEKMTMYVSNPDSIRDKTKRATLIKILNNQL